MSGQVVAIEGAIGVGKTTAGMLLKDSYEHGNEKVAFFEEKVSEELLSLFLNDMKRYAFAFQLSMLESRINTQKEARCFADSGGIAIIDRSTIGDRAFAQLQLHKGNITEEEWAVYNAIYQRNTHLPDKIIYLACTPQISLERIRKRGRTSETKDYTMEYLQSLTQSYEDSLQNTFMIPITRVEWNTERNAKDIVKTLSCLL